MWCIKFFYCGCGFYGMRLVFVVKKFGMLCDLCVRGVRISFFFFYLGLEFFKLEYEEIVEVVN